MFLLYFLIAIIFSVLLFYAVLFVRNYRNPLRTIPGQQSSLFSGYVANLLSKDYIFFEYYKDQRNKYGTVRKTYLPLGYIGLEISDPEWIRVSLYFLLARVARLVRLV